MSKLLTESRLRQLLEKAYQKGFDDGKFTGGNPVMMSTCVDNLVYISDREGVSAEEKAAVLAPSPAPVDDNLHTAAWLAIAMLERTAHATDTDRLAAADALRAALASKVQPKRTPSSHWAATGEPDPHGDRYTCERAALTLGDLTDDELANGAFLNYNEPLNIKAVMENRPGYHPPIAWMTAVKDRIRWLSRALEKATAVQAPAPAHDQAVTHGHMTMMERTKYPLNHEWHVAVNRHSEAWRTEGKDWGEMRFMYEAKHMADEVPRMVMLFKQEREQCSMQAPVPVKDNHLSCCLGVKARECPHLLALEKIERCTPDEVDAAKAWTCAAHIVSQGGDVANEGYMLTVSDRMFWNKMSRF